MAGIGYLTSHRFSEDNEKLLKLKNFAFYSLTNNLKHTILRFNPLRETIHLPNQICDEFIQKFQEFHGNFDDEIARLFSDTKTTTLKNVELRNSTIGDEALGILLQHKLQSLSLLNCKKLTKDSFSLIAKISESVETFVLGIGTIQQKLPVEFFNGYPKLRELALEATIIPDNLQFSQLQHLTYLDLSTQNRGDRRNIRLEFLSDLLKLETLILHNIFLTSDQLNEMPNMRNLKFLDISHDAPINERHQYGAPDETLGNLIAKLPSLTHLDISGTNLDGNVNNTPGLESRRQNPLNFLGLFNTLVSEWRNNFDDTPAIEIAGTANEEQLLTALKYNLERSSVLIKILVRLDELINSNRYSEISKVLNAVLESMDKNKDNDLQIYGREIIWKILARPDYFQLNALHKYQIVRVVLKGIKVNLDTYAHDFVLQRGFQILETLKDYVGFQYENLIDLLLKCILKWSTRDSVVLKTIGLLKDLTLQVNWKTQLVFYDEGIIKAMLKLIRERITRSVFDDIMIMALTILTNVTILSEMHCITFIQSHGIDSVVKCLNAISNREELLKQLMTFLFKISQSQNLRYGFMTAENIQAISGYINSFIFSVKYSAVGIITHIALDGPEAWTIETPKLQDALKKIDEAIDSWDLFMTEEFVSDPLQLLLNLLQCSETPECRLFGLWTLAYLTNRNPSEYRQFMQQNNVLGMLQEMTRNPVAEDKNENLALIILGQY